IHTITDFTDHMTLICQCQRVNLCLDEVTGFVMRISGSNKGVEKSFVCFVQFMAGWLAQRVWSFFMVLQFYFPYLFSSCFFFVFLK
ncbi:hypothetical protein, partial [Escherichia coli]|uniref:hypothetical protein n=1 Tax=Escherichia coli TaxID=562 RepID=UPI001BB2589D